MTATNHFPLEYYEDVRVGDEDQQLDQPTTCPPGPSTYVGVQDIVPVGHEDRYRQGVRRYFEARLDDDTIRTLALTRPHDGNRKTDTWVAHTGAWFTGIGGHNMHAALHHAGEGISTIYMAAPGESAPGRMLRNIGKAALHPARITNDIRSIELAKTAAIMHGILDVIGMALPGDTIQTEAIALIGESHGAMSGLGMVAQAESHGREIVTARFVAPCYIDALSTLSAAGTIAHQLPAEGKAIVNVARHTPRHVAGHLLGTISPDPLAQVYQLATWPTLHGGQPREFIRFIPTAQHMHITVFKDDASGQADKFVDAFPYHPNVTVEVLPGAHMSIAEPAMLARTTAGLVKDLVR